MRWLKWLTYTILPLFVILNILTAFHAYKFTRFYNAHTTIVKKPQQMSGWEKTQALFFGIDYPKKKITILPSIPYNNFSLKTEDGLTLKGWLVKKNDSIRTKGAVIMLHGHANNRSSMISEAQAFSNFGYSVYMIDFRAHGESDGEVCTIGYNESKDVKAVYDYAKKQFTDNQIILYGISLGAATITKALYDYNHIKPSGIILEMPFASLTDAVNGKLRSMDLPEQPLCGLLTFWGGTQHGFWGFTHNPADYVKRISCPVLLQWGVKDTRVNKEETNLLFNNIGSKQKTLVTYGNSGHESLYKNETSKWLQNVSRFLQ